MKTKTQLFSNFIFLVILAVLSFAVSSCQSVSKQNKGSRTQWDFHPVWVQNTLANPNTGFRKINRMTPLIYKDQIIVGNSIDGLVCYNLNSRQEMWRILIPQGIEASAAIINDRLFAGSQNGKVYSIDLSKGQILWTFDTKSEVVAEPLLNDGVLYFISGSQSVFALDASSGKQLWTYNRQDTSSLMTVRGGAKPALSDGSLYFGFSDGSVVSLNAKTGTPQWEITLNRNTRFKDIDASPVVSGDMLFISSYDDKVYAVSKKKGEIIWKSQFGGASAPLVFSDRLIVASSKGDLASLSKKDGSVIWKIKTNQGIYTEPTLLKGSILVGETQGRILLLDGLTGEQRTSFEPGRGVFTKASISADQSMVYFVSNEGNLYGLNLVAKDNSSVYYLK